jgi:hypothetical protein
MAAVAALLRRPVCRDAAAWLAGELHRAALHPGGGQAAAAVRWTAAQEGCCSERRICHEHDLAA